MKNLYKWQWIIGILTFIAITINAFGKGFNFRYFLDLVLGVGINILIVRFIFVARNWIRGKSKNKIKKNEEKN